MGTPKKTTTKKSAAAKTSAPRKRVVKSEDPAVEQAVHHAAPAEKHEKVTAVAEFNLDSGKYSYAVGRRKTSVANVRLFEGKGKSTVNNKDMLAYFGNQSYLETALKPLQLTGLESRLYVYVNANGGGLNSQAQAVAHGIAQAIAKVNADFRKVLKKNGLMTRDSRMKERKKPGLKRARRGPQWAKR